MTCCQPSDTAMDDSNVFRKLLLWLILLLFQHVLLSLLLLLPFNSH